MVACHLLHGLVIRKDLADCGGVSSATRISDKHGFGASSAMGNPFLSPIRVDDGCMDQ